MKRLKVWLLTCLIPLIGFAQDNPDAVKEQIRDLKKSEKYVYAESTSPNGEAEARQYSTDALHANVIGLLSEAGKNKDEAEKAWVRVEKQAQQLIVPMGNMVKVFSYIPKSSLDPDAPGAESVSPALVDEAKEVKVTPTSEVENTNIPSESDFTADAALIAMILGNSSEVMIESKPQSGKEIATALAQADSVTEPQPAIEREPVKEEAPVVVEQPEVPQPVNVENPLETLPESSRILLTTLLAKQTFKEAIAYLSEMKEKGSAIYGRIKTMTSPENSYLAIVKNGQLVTVLDKGKAIRINLKTNVSEPVKNYVGYGIIWFQIF